MLTQEEQDLVEDLRERCERAARLIRRFREEAQERIDQGTEQAIVKFNGGHGAVLCPVCSRITRTGVNLQKAKPEICPPGIGCGEFEESDAQS